jgi:hypothetical protein
MKINSSIIILMILFLTSSCSNDPSHSSTQLNNQSNEEESWAFEYIIHNDRIYIMSDEIVSNKDVGELIGEIMRNTDSEDVEEGFKEKNFDSNSLKIGTPIYKYKRENHKIVYKLDGKYFIASPK